MNKPIRIKLDENENPYGFPKEIFEKVAREMDSDYIARYTKAPTKEVSDALIDYIKETARVNFIDGEWITVSAGADDAIKLLMELRPERVVLFPPTYFYYYYFVKGLKLNYEEFPLIDDLYIPEVELKEGDMVFLPNPNNPTGHLFKDEEILKLLESPATVVIDEAYFEFSWKTSVKFLKDHKNLVIIRTFSKAFAFAGQRFGYIIAHPEMIEKVNSVKGDYNVPSFVMKLAVKALRNRSLFLGKIKEIEMERLRMAEELENLGLKPFPSQTNFLYFKVKNAEEIKDKLSEMGIYVRVLWDGIRVSIGKKEENDAFIEALKEILG
ncbi:MAG: histidinol-phosphate aminotransferase family protein [Thermotogaceae bacterium]|nr:histidinol-phosphate aminotransferase family protein [Thermotogaceae bacterium]